MTSSVAEDEAAAADAGSCDLQHTSFAEGDAGGVENPWRHISNDELTTYHGCVKADAPGAEAHLASALGLSNSRHEVPQAARVVFVTAALAFASRERLSLQQQGVLVNACQALLAAAEAAMARCKAQQVLKDILIPMAKCHTDPERPSFTPLEVEAIAAHFGTVFFRHYHLYQFVLSQPRPKEEQYLEGFLETMHLPAFDGVALPEEEWRQKQAADQKQREAEEQAAAEAAQQAAAEAEAARRAQQEAEAEQERVRQLAVKPATLEEAIERAVAARVAQERTSLRAACERELAGLRDELAALKAGAAKEVPKGKK